MQFTIILQNCILSYKQLEDKKDYVMFKKLFITKFKNTACAFKNHSHFQLNDTEERTLWRTPTSQRRSSCHIAEVTVAL